MESEDLRQICSNYKGNEVIFNNKYICFRGFPFYHANLISKGICRLKHIVDKDGELKTDAYFTSKGLTSWNILQIKHIFEKIPPSWKRQMHLTEEKKKDIDMEEILFIVSDKIVHVSELVSKNLYRTILNCKLEVPLVVNHLKESFGLSIRDIENTFLRPRKCTLNSKLREFQFKMLHGIIYTNLDLYRFGLVSSDLCSFCKKEVETYRHLFYDCEHIRPLWNACGDALNLPTLKELNWEGIFFGAPLGDISKTYFIKSCNFVTKICDISN